LNIGKVTKGEAQYPWRLCNIKNPPQILYYRGDIQVCNRRCLAIVGSRKATQYGRWAAYTMAKRAAEYGVVVVSGMATGVDAEAHRGALDGGGRTIAVLGCGPDVCYPASNAKLMERIINNGVIVSEYPPGRKPFGGQFPVRNRIISGLSEAVVVAEAGIKSGSLITVGWALEQNKDVYAVPGPINNVNSYGTNKLIQDGAMPIISVDEVLTVMGLTGRLIEEGYKDVLGQDEKNLLELIVAGGDVTIDELCYKTGKSAGQVAALVSLLEIKGIIIADGMKIIPLHSPK
jgi:DNA processing protein